RSTGNSWVVWLMRLEVLVGVGLLLILAGLAGTGLAMGQWGSAGFAELKPDEILRVVMPSATTIAIGTICMFSGLLASLLTRTDPGPLGSGGTAMLTVQPVAVLIPSQRSADPATVGSPADLS